ncbi:MAG: Ig-like domain-containing protein [Paludibacter sp.]
MKKHLYIALSLIVILFSSCQKELVVTGVSLDKTTLALCQGANGQFIATVQPTNIPSPSTLSTVQWSSSNPAVATVVNGKVTAVSQGTAQILATVGSYNATCNITVSAAITSISLNKTSISLKVETSQTLTSTLLPTQTPEVASNLLWTSTNPSVATVDNAGKITAVSDGNTTIVASIGTVTAICSVTVYTTIASSLMGSNYYILSVGTSTANVLGAKVIADYRADGVNNNFYVWNGLNEGAYSGTNFYGNAENWLSFAVTGVGGWSGASVNVKPGTELDKLKAVTDDTSGKYYLHFAIKSSSTNSYAFKLGYGVPAITFVLGTLAMESTSPYGNFTRNGQWQEVEIPMSYFKGKGLSYTTGMATTDVFVMLAGGTAGIKLEVDAVFIYKKP